MSHNSPAMHAACPKIFFDLNQQIVVLWSGVASVGQGLGTISQV